MCAEVCWGFLTPLFAACQILAKLVYNQQNSSHCQRHLNIYVNKRCVELIQGQSQLFKACNIQNPLLSLCLASLKNITQTPMKGFSLLLFRPLKRRQLWGISIKGQLQAVFSNKNADIVSARPLFPGSAFQPPLTRCSLRDCMPQMLSDISRLQILPGGFWYRPWKWPWAKANHAWHCTHGKFGQQMQQQPYPQ